MTNKIFNPLLNETFVFRPIHEDGDIHAQVLRYANGNWIPDDGEYDLSFIINNFAYFVDLPAYSNLLWTWSDSKLSKKWIPEYLYRYVHSWHDVTIENTPISDEFRRYRFSDEDAHPNNIAKKSAMDKCCKIYHCANGRAIRIDDAQYDIDKWTKANEYIKQGLLRIQRTMQPIVLPPKLECYLCVDNGKGHLIQALNSYKEDLESQIEQNQENINKAESTIVDCEYENEKYQAELTEVSRELHKLGVEVSNAN